MPRRNNDNRVFCVTHAETEMMPVNGFHSLTQVNKRGENVTFHPSSGVPVKIFFCPRCGYIEIYTARMIDEWNNS